MFTAGILTISDRGARGERPDKSGEVIRGMLARRDFRVLKYGIVPDEAGLIAARLTEWADGGEVDLILTTGGTGLGPRDVTPEATLSVVDKTVPGLAEVIRLETFRVTPAAVLSRAVAGVRKRCLILNLPGNPKGVRECLEVALTVIPHAIEVITGAVTEHAPAEEKGAH